MKLGTDANGQYRMRDGRKIYIDVLDTGIVAHKRRNKGDLFSVLYHKEAVPALKALCPGALVWVAIVHRMHLRKTRVFELPTGQLRRWGVSRSTYTRALRRLTAAGCVRVVKRVPGHAPTIEVVHR
jgi:hypothetical protein